MHAFSLLPSPPSYVLYISISLYVSLSLSYPGYSPRYSPYFMNAPARHAYISLVQGCCSLSAEERPTFEQVILYISTFILTYAEEKHKYNTNITISAPHPHICPNIRGIQVIDVLEEIQRETERVFKRTASVCMVEVSTNPNMSNMSSISRYTPFQYLLLCLSLCHFSPFLYTYTATHTT